MNHDRLKAQIFLYDDPETEERERRGIEAHIASCRECARTLENWRRIKTPLSGIPERESSGFSARVMDRVAALEKGAPEPEADEKTSSFEWFFPALGYAFAGILMFAAITNRLAPVSTENLLMTQLPQGMRQMLSAEPNTVSLMGI